MRTQTVESPTDRASRLAANRAKLAALRPDRIDPHLAYSLAETAASIRISLPQVYKLIAEGAIKTIPGIRPMRVSGAEIIRITTSGAA